MSSALQKGDPTQEGGQPQVSVVIPAYNRAPILPRAIRSVLGQTMRDLEVIVVDDRSEDNSQEVVGAIAESEPRLRYLLNSENRGAPFSRNRGLAEARGRYIAFLDDDDEWLPAKLEMQLELIRDFAVVGCRRRTGSRPRDLQPVSPVPFVERTLEEFHFNNRGFSPTTMLMRAEHLREIGGFDEALEASQGIDIFTRMVTTYGRAAYVDHVLSVSHVAHGFARITAPTPRRIRGCMREFEKNHALRTPAARRYRRAFLELIQAQAAPDLPSRLRHIKAAFAQTESGRWRDYGRLYFGQLLLPSPAFARAWHIYIRMRSRGGMTPENPRERVNSPAKL